ncbi:2-isopropylmalate synthase [Marinobacter sp. F4206]|uniref:2-isopropylmalate synthase n=1 Tax=Marinobacter sp. F4206 TaxID=2861777 RepID=UPI001C5F2212|nr:2-isopropylmalate synthase [Marinobacter sp. F4206]MBW4935609.1 2-isopropylmalate synthase [Marinobacter sp. F4206]
MMQSETERQFYLGMAGVQLWYARNPLPGAAPSPDYVFDDEQEAEAAPSEAALPSVSGRQAPGASSPGDAGREVGATRVANLQALMADAQPSSSRPDNASVPLAETEAAVGGKLEVPEHGVPTAVSGVLKLDLNLQIWIGRGIALIASLSGEASLRLQETLAENILKSLGETTVRNVGPVRWPVFNNLRAPGNSLADLRAVLSHTLSTLQGQKLVVLGLEGPDGYQGDDSWLQHISGIRPELIFPGTLAELASNPSRKRALWQELKPLAGQ